MDYSRLYKYQHEEDKKDEEEKIDLEEFEPELEKKDKHIRFRLLMYIFVVSLLVILYVGNTVKVKSLLKKETKLEKEIEKIENNNRLLQTKINKLESPERITNIAVKKFGMIKPDIPPKVISEK
jgi:cell division protein FtsL